MGTKIATRPFFGQLLQPSKTAETMREDEESVLDELEMQW
jgi:hypothetical protein